jgi:hypothetical protein
VPGQQQDVQATFPQRRDTDLEDVDPIVQVVSEAALRDGAPQVLIGRGNHPDVHFDGTGPAKANEFPLLEHPQERRLRHQRHLGHFVEKEHAAMGQFNVTRLQLLGAREGAAVEAEQLRFQQCLGQSRAVDGHEWATFVGRDSMDEPGHDFLARARFTLQAGCCLGRRNLSRPFQDRAPWPTAADQRAKRTRRFQLCSKRDDFCPGAITCCVSDFAGDISIHTNSFVAMRPAPRDSIPSPSVSG